MRRFFFMTCAFLLFCVVGVAPAATPRFVANNGNDGNAGTLNAPWATLARAGRVRDATVLLRRGDVFRETADLGPISLGAYGPPDRPLPVIAGSLAIQGWKEDEKHIYVATVSKSVEQLYVDGQQMWLARVKEAIARKRRPYFISRRPVSKVVIRAIDEKSDMQVTIEPGLDMGMKWSKLDAIDHRSLAESLTGKGSEPEDRALAAFFLYLEGRSAQAYEQLGKAGAAGNEVESIFAPKGAKQ